MHPGPVLLYSSESSIHDVTPFWCFPLVISSTLRRRVFQFDPLFKSLAAGLYYPVLSDPS